MKTKLFLIIFINLIFTNSFGQGYKINVDFKIDDTNFPLSKPSLAFTSAGKTYLAKFKGNEILLPSFPATLKYTDVCFVNGIHKIIFKQVDIRNLKPNQAFNWTFAILNRNFEKISSTLKTEKLIKLYIWEFNPLEEGDGIVLTNPVYKK